MFEGLLTRNVRSIILILCFFERICDVSSEKEYLIETEKCRIPKYEPFNEDALQLWIPQKYTSCSRRPLLTYTSKTDDAAFIHVAEHLKPLYGKNITCCTSNIARENNGQDPDDNISITECEDFINSTQLKSDTILVKCRDANGWIVYANAHSVILKAKNLKTTRNLHKKPVSVLFIVIDSVSRLNLIRTMPKTRDYLLMNNFIEMEGYNKIDDNTFPNFMALLSGLNAKATKKQRCTGKHIDDLDNCPLVWYDIRDKGYITAYGEDWGPLNTFNYLRKGFNKKPTDFYFRPYVLASETLGTVSVSGASYCAGPETSGERQLNLALDFAKTFKGNPYFGIFWMNTFSHQAMNTPTRFDDTLRTFFTDLKAEGVLNDSIVILLSDHGIRMDPWIRKTLTGWYEERLPMNLISVPRWFQEMYPTEYTNLQQNSKQLTSTYDLYMTLQHLFKLSLSNFDITPAAACPKCVSLFERITPRTCSEAGIPEEWCTCIGDLKPLNHTSELVIRGVKFVLNHMKSTLRENHLADLCNTLELSQVKLAAESETSELNEKYLFLNFETNPYVDFIVTLKYATDKREPEFRILFDVIKLSWSNNKCAQKYWHYCDCKF